MDILQLHHCLLVSWKITVNLRSLISSYNLFTGLFAYNLNDSGMSWMIFIIYILSITVGSFVWGVLTSLSTRPLAKYIIFLKRMLFSGPG